MNLLLFVLYILILFIKKDMFDYLITMIILCDEDYNFPKISAVK